jgi:steroid delta-isomerase-like uncharacterized protein
MAETSTTGHERLMNDYTALWNGDFSKLDAVADSVTIRHPSAPEGEIHGREALEAFIREYHAGFPDFHIEVHDPIARDDVVTKEYTMAGTHEGESNGVPPTGREFENTGMAKILVADGEVREDRLYFDRSEALEQLGLTEAQG